MLTSEHMKALGASAEVAEALPRWLAHYKIRTPSAVAMFLATAAEETMWFKRFEENLNYTAEQLVRMWPSIFETMEMAAAYAHSPRDIANMVYANRMGNGDVNSDDGWRHRGRGMVQITGKEGQERVLRALMVPLSNVEYLSTPEGACRSGAWWWRSGVIRDWRTMTVYDLVPVCNDGDFYRVSCLITGADPPTSWSKRTSHFNRILKVLGG